MFFGINVWNSIYSIGASCYLIPFFSNVCVHLEGRKRGTKFPHIMKELYDGLLPYEHVCHAVEELKQIDQGLKRLPVSCYIYDFIEPGKPRPEGMKMNANAHNLSDYITNMDGDEIVPMIGRALEEALYFKENIWIGDSVMGGNTQKRPYMEENMEHFIFVEKNGSLLLDRYFGTMKKVVIPEFKDGKKVTAIGEMAFYDNRKVEEVIIPDSIEELYARSFSGCHELKKVAFGKCVTKIGKEAFASCLQLSQIVLPGEIKVIEEKTFESCYELTDLVVPDGVVAIEDEAFANCKKLSHITIPASVNEISEPAFKGIKKYLTIITSSGCAAAKYAKKYRMSLLTEDQHEINESSKRQTRD